MWIKPLNHYVDPRSMTTFVPDIPMEVDKAVLKGIPKKELAYEEVPAPWDALIDEKAVRVGELQVRIAEAEIMSVRVENELLNMQYREGPGKGCMQALLEVAEVDCIEAEQLLKQLESKAAKAAENAVKAPSEANEKNAAELAGRVDAARRAEREKSCLFLKAQGRSLLLQGDIGLTELEVAGDRDELAAMRAELYELRPDIKPKDDEDGPTEKKEAPDGSGPAHGKDAADAKGQTDAAGQADAVQG